MGSPYTSQSTSGYNSSPPADDGSAVASNQILWATIKTKLADVLKTFGENINSATSTAFSRVPGGATTATTSTSYQVLSADQGKLIIVTASGVTITTPDATSVSSPFLFRIVNTSSGTITVDGSGSQTIDGAANVTLAAGAGLSLDTDGSNWFTDGYQGTLVGKQLMYGEIINGTISESNATNAATYAVKTLAGADPSASDPVIVCFRNATIGTGNYVYRTITSAMSLTLSSGSTLGATSGVAFKVWLVIFDDGGTLRLGAINCLSGLNIYPLGRLPLASSTAEGGAGAADSAHTFYTGSAVTSKPYVILGYASYESGLATAGTWNVSPTRIQLYGHGVPLPGETIQTAGNISGALATGTTVVPDDDTIPQNTEGDQYMTQAITPTSAANVLVIRSQGILAHSASSEELGWILFQDTTADALAGNRVAPQGANQNAAPSVTHSMLAGTTSSTTFNLRGGSSGAGTTTFNGTGGGRKWGGVCNSFVSIAELMT